ncbi:MAG TPA: hypothetical protein VK934_11620, partial [Fimbriimonas sp.]|nr:hypothetical protein [Fimbriimonas sp.]
WMGGTDNDEVADEWFLRAPVMQEEPEQALESDRGRRRRKRRGPRERGEEDVVVRQFEEEIGLGVMFRKKS